MNMPTRPVHTLPLSSTTTASPSVSTASAMTAARAASVWSVAPDPDVEERQRVEAEDQQPGHGDRGEHRVDRRPPVLGPVHVLQMQDQRELVEHQRRADPEKGCRDRELGYSPVDGQSHHRDTGDHDQDHTDHHVVDVQRRRRAEMLRGCHHLRGLSLSAWLRMYRTIVRVTKKVRMNATRQKTSGSRPCGIARPRSSVSVHAENLRRQARDVPGIWSGAPRRPIVCSAT